MNAIPGIDMSEVTRLTLEGRLAEATALLQGHPFPPQSHPFRSQPSPFPSQDRPVPPAPAPVQSMPFADMMRAFGLTPWSTPDTRPQVSPGSAPRRLGGRFEDRIFKSAAGSLGYKLYIPEGATAGRPLVIMLHGCSQSPDDFAAGTRMNELAQEQMFLVAYPAQSASANPQRCWNWFNPADQNRGSGEPEVIAGITRAIMREKETDPRRVYIAGLSAGGAAAANMAAAYPDLYAAVCVHSGLACGAASDVASALGAMRGTSRHSSRDVAAVPTIVFHGDRDTTVHAVNADHVMAQAKGATDWQTHVIKGATDSGHRFTRIVQCRADGVSVHEQWILHGGAHAWSGGSAAGSYTEPRGADASREMLRFFWGHMKG